MENLTTFEYSDHILQEVTEQFRVSAAHYDRTGEFPAANFKLLHKFGLLALPISKHLGGPGGTIAHARRVISAVARGEPSTALILTMQYFQLYSIQNDDAWTSDMGRLLLQDALTHGGLINALRVEPALGTPMRGGLPATIATRTSDGWSLSGEKIYSTGSHGLSWMIVWARTAEPEPSVGQFLVPKKAKGVVITEDWDHIGMRASNSHRVKFNAVRLPLEHAIGVHPLSAKHPGVSAAGALWMSVLISAVYDGIARSARDWLVEFLQARRPSNLNASLATLPRFQEVIGRIDTLLLTNSLLLDSAESATFNPNNGGQIKYIVTNNAIRAVELAIEVSGNPGLSRSNPLERHYRDVLCGRVHSPQDDSLLISVGLSALSEEKKHA